MQKVQCQSLVLIGIGLYLVIPFLPQNHKHIYDFAHLYNTIVNTFTICANKMPKELINS